MPKKRLTAGSALRRRKLSFVLFPCILFLLAGSVAFGVRWLTAPRLVDFLPSQTPIAGQTDLRWCWGAVYDLRRIPQIQQGIARAEAAGQFSVEQDILPWVGQAGGAVLRLDGQKTTGIICLQVRNWPAFLLVMQ